MNTKPKVMHISFAGWGGVDIYIRMLIRDTSEQNDIICICPSCCDENYYKNCGARVYNMDLPREISPLEDLKAVFKLRKIIKKEAPQIIYCHSSMAGAVGRLAAIFTKSKVVYNPHGWSFDMSDCGKKKSMAYLLIEKFLAPFTQKIITISDYERNIAIEKKIAPPYKIVTILNGVDTKNISEIKTTKENLGYSSDDIIIGCIARIEEQKDPILFAKVCGEISKKIPNAKFIWVGDGSLRESFEKALKENNIFDKTVITGWTDTPHLYSSVFDVCVLFSKWEGFGLVVAEALSQGKPVVATDVGGISEIIGDCGVGKAVDSRDEKLLAESVIEFINMENKKELETKCIERSKQFDFKITAEQTVKIFREMLI